MAFDLRSPVTADQLAGLDDRAETVQFSSALTPAEYALLGRWFAGQPAKTLRVYGSHDATITDLEFLRYFPTLRSFRADFLHDALEDLDGLRHLPADVRSLGLGRLGKRLPLAPLARFTELQELRLDGRAADVGVIGHLTNVRRLSLRSVTLPDLSLLGTLPHLETLDIELGGTRDLGVVPQLRALTHLALWRVRGLTDLAPIAEHTGLESVHLQSLGRVGQLPGMARMTGLRRLWLEAMKGVRDLSPIATAPRLRRLAVIDMPQLEPSAFTPLVAHPTLETLRFGLGSARRNDAVRRIIDLPTGGEWGGASGPA